MLERALWLGAASRAGLPLAHSFLSLEMSEHAAWPGAAPSSPEGAHLSGGEGGWRVPESAVVFGAGRVKEEETVVTGSLPSVIVPSHLTHSVIVAS